LADKSTNPIVRLWKWWFTPRSNDPTVTYRERALRVLLPTFLLLRLLGTTRRYFVISDLPEPYAPEWLSVLFFVVPILLSFYFLQKQNVGWAGTFFVLHWFLIDLVSLPTEGYWYAGFQISLIIQVILAALLLPGRGMFPFLVIQLVTFGIWGHWLDVNYYDPPLLSSGQPVAVFWRTIVTLGAQETILLFIVRYLRLAMEKSLRLQGSTIGQLEQEINERQQTDARLRGIFQNSPDFIMEMDRDGIILFANRRVEDYVGTEIYQYLPPDSRKQVEKILAQAYETGESKVLEIQLLEDDGSLQWYSIRVGSIISEGRVDRLVIISTNIHAQKEVELQVKRRAEQLGIIVEIGHAVSTLQDLDSVLEIIYQQIQRIAPVDTFFICLLGDDKKQLEFPITYDMGVRYKETGGQLRPESRLGQVILTGKPFRLHRTAEEVMEAEKEGIRGGVGDAKRKSGSLLFLPLHDALEAFGVLSIQSYELNAYPDELVETLSGIADQVAIAIQNARLYTNLQQELTERTKAEQQIQQRLHELAAIHAVSRAATSELELEALFDLISTEIFNLFNIQEIYFALHNQQADQVDFPYYRSRDQKIETSPVPYGQGLSSRVIMSRAPILINEDYEQRSAELGVVRFKPGQYDISRNSWLGVPIQVGETVIGMVCVMNLERENAFTESDVRLLTTIAANVGIAIQNAQLYTTVQQELVERKRVEEVRERLIGELEQKNAELERFTYTVSHDLRSPIVTIKGFVGMLEKDLRENRPDRVQSDLQRIAGAADKMDALLRDLLELSRIGRLVNPPVEIDTVQLIRDALESVDAQIRSKNVKVEIAPDLPRLYGDRIRLREVFENLIGNAAKYMGEQANPLIEIGINTHGDEPVLYVKDNGMGIDTQYHTRIFNLFEKLNPAIEGTGIGLTLVKRIVEYHGGRIWVESDGLDKGSTFCFTVPDGKVKT